MDINHLSKGGSYKFISIYAKDIRFFTIINKYLMRVLKTGSYAYKEPNTPEELKDTIAFSMASPLGYSRWITSIDTSKVRINKDLSSKMKESSYSTNVIYSDTFKSHQINRKLLSFPQRDYLELMFITLTIDEVMFFQKEIVPEKNRLDTGILKRVHKGYRTRPEKILDLFYHMKETSVEAYKDVIKILGSPDNTQEKFLLRLLEVDIVSDRSLETNIRNRYKDIEDLVLQIGYDACLGYLRHTLKDIMYIKEQYMAGVMYKSVAKQSIEYKSNGEIYESDRNLTYIKKNLSRYMDTIKKIPYTRYVLLLKAMNRGAFKDNLDTYKFISTYLVSTYEHKINQ